MRGEYIKKAVIYPYNKIAHAFIRFRELLSFEIVGVVDFGENVGKDTGELIGIERNGIIITDEFEKLIKECDTLIITQGINIGFFYESISEKNLEQLFMEIVNVALKNEKNIYSLEADLRTLQKEEYKSIIRYPTFDVLDYYENNNKQMKDDGEYYYKTDTPIIGIFGTSPNQGKWSTTLTIRRELLKLNKKIGNIGTESSSYLFGCDALFSNMYEGDKRHEISMFRHIIRKLDTKGYDSIFITGQSGIVPFKLNVNSPVFTIPSIKYLFASNPDRYILIVNHTDPKKHIEDSIRGLEVLGKKHVIALVLPDMKVVGKTKWGEALHERVNLTEMNNKKEELFRHFNIPVADIVSKQGVGLLIDVIQREIDAIKLEKINENSIN